LQDVARKNSVHDTKRRETIQIDSFSIYPLLAPNNTNKQTNKHMGTRFTCTASKSNSND